MAQQDTLFAVQNFSTLAGSSAAVFIVSNAIQRAFDFNPKWLALAISEVVVIFATYIGNPSENVEAYGLAILNGCLVYCTAVGGAAIAGAPQRVGNARGLELGIRVGRRGFFTSWF
jgi:hypothetical protein